MNDKLQKIREIIIKANPEIVLGEHEHYAGPDSPPEIEVEFRPIRLSDVLLAMDKKGLNYLVDLGGVFVKQIAIGLDKIEWTNYSWNLKEDDLSKQSEETINFLAKVLT